MLQDDGNEALETTDAAPTPSVTEAAAATDPASPLPSRGGAPAVEATAGSASAAPAQASVAVTEFDIGSPPTSPMEPEITDIADVTDSFKQSPIVGGPVEDFWTANAAAAVAQSSAGADASMSSASASKQQDDEDDDESGPGVQKMFQEAIPMDKLQNGVSAAKKMWSWGFSKVKEGANKLTDDLSKSDFSKEAERVSARMEAAINQGAGEVTRLAKEGGDKFYTTVKKVQEELEPTLTQTQQKLSESADSLGNTLDAHIKTAEEKASEIAEKMQLKEKAVEAKETAKSGFFNAMSGAAKTAIWFQSLGSTAHDSEDEEEDFGSAPAAPGQAEPSPTMNFMPPARDTSVVEAAPSEEVMARAVNEPVSTDTVERGPAAAYTVPGPEPAPMPTLDAAPLPATDISNSTLPEEVASATSQASAAMPASASAERVTVEAAPAPAASTAAAEPVAAAAAATAATPAPTPEVVAAPTPSPAAAAAPASAAPAPELAPALEAAPAPLAEATPTPEPAAAAAAAPAAVPATDTKPAPAEEDESF